MNKSGFLQRQKQQQQLYMDITERIMKQFMLDTLQMTLHDEGWGYKRVLDLTEKWGAKYSTYYTALGTSDEADYLRFAMDRELSDIIKGNMELAPFEAGILKLRRLHMGVSDMKIIDANKFFERMVARFQCCPVIGATSVCGYYDVEDLRDMISNHPPLTPKRSRL